MKKETHTPRSVRLLKVGETIRHALSAIFQREEFRDPALKGVSVTVSEVRVSPDLRNATAYVVPLGGNHQDDVIAALNRAAAFLRGCLGRSIRLKYTPGLHFELDDSFDQAGHIHKLLETPVVRRDLGRAPDEAD